MEAVPAAYHFLRNILWSGWGLIAAIMEAIEQVDKRHHEWGLATSNKFHARLVRWALRWAKRVHPRWIALGCILVATFLTWDDAESRASDAGKTIQTDAQVEKSDKQRIETLRDLLAEQQAHTQGVADNYEGDWPPLSIDEQRDWADLFKTYHIQSMVIFRSNETGRFFFRSLLYACKATGVKIVSGMGAGDPGSVTLFVSPSDPAKDKILALLKRHFPSVFSVDLRKGDTIGRLQLFIGEKI